ncbi:MAG: D-glycero-beta-D-manno-heptose-7-phosphate kinase [Cyclobacteriaceae bacterium]|nr:D-glycero-beta-D-manno-heptose-7-phosphate kinase [Cyclobacteriaceae bacterium]
MPNLRQIFTDFNSLNILIVGDVMLDSYIWGVVERISPEAPVPIVNVKKRDVRLGGAANVALNVQALGATPVMVALYGDDEAGIRLQQIVKDQHLSTDGLVLSTTRPTTVKTRVIASSQHVVRVDDESDKPSSAEEEQQLWKRIENLLPTCQAVIFEDYDKGVISPGLIYKTVTLAKQLGKPTIVDPKKRNFLAYEQVTLFKPNLKEMREGLKVELEAGNQLQLEAAIKILKEKLQVEGVMATLSEHGVYIDYQNEKIKLPAHAREIADVSGAGDTVVSIAALAVALKLTPKQIAALSNLGGGLVCQHVGVVPINKAELLAEAERIGI